MRKIISTQLNMLIQFYEWLNMLKIKLKKFAPKNEKLV